MLISPDGQCLLRSVNADGQPVPREHIVRAIGQAFLWQRELTTGGGTLRDVGDRFGVCNTRVRALLVLTQLAPAIVKAALTGALAETITLEDLECAALQLDWDAQRRSLGMN